MTPTADLMEKSIKGALEHELYFERSYTLQKIS